MRKRSTRKAALRAKQRTQAISDYENLPDRKVLQGALPPKREVIQKRTFNAAKDRLKPERRMELALQRPRRVNPIQTISVGPMTRHVLFLNVGNERILEAVQALVRGNATPPWTRHLRGLSTKNGKLLLTENGKTLPFAFSEEKRQAVKTLYFDPKEPSTIQPITDNLREKFCNISRKNVRTVLRSLETYQLQFPRRKHPKIQHHTVYTQPGVIAMDTFFPSANSGWVKRSGGVLVCMDVWSRFSRAYALEKKEGPYFRKAMRAFFIEFTSLGHLPRRLLTDKGSELKVGTELIEKYRLPRDKGQDMHLRSFTGTPVQVVENMNAQYQRRLEAYRIAGLHDDYADLLWDISEQINNQKRAKRGNLTPYQLLDLPAQERKVLNQKYDTSYHGIGVEAQKKLPFLKPGDHVRKLMMTFKEQAKGAKKGFQEKWSRDTYQVLRVSALRRNPQVKKYSIGDPNRTYFRHELLLIPSEVDQVVMTFPTSAPYLVEDRWRSQ